MSSVSPVISDEFLWNALQARKMESVSARSFNFFRSRGLRPILIKGFSIARFYPDSEPRSYKDVDLAFDPQDYRKALEIRSTEEGARLAVDLHKEFRHLDTRPWDEAFDDSECVDINGVQVSVPCAEDNLRMVCTHWLNDGGESKERLRDIYYAVKNRPATFDWDKCLRAVAANRRTWIVTAILLAAKYLDLDIDDLPHEIVKSSLPAWVTRTVEKEWRSGRPSLELSLSLDSPSGFFTQLRKRIPPNPIQATIENEGDLVNGNRLRYQLQSMSRRAIPSLKATWLGLTIKASNTGK